ncbi:MAG: PEFG-CTERM sorting domain-containing protein [Candidatus Nitrosopelagicus sp.]|nr:PEFG-CTERM sorting domain-containing protein [Candidatus Nitrosopelagicus sp.]
MKSKEVLILGIASLILLPFLGGESFAQSNQVLTVTTEKESYAAGEPIEILGLVDIVLEGTPVVIRIVSPMGNMIHPAQIDVDSDGSFSETVSTSIGGLWKETGTYTIQVNYGDNSTQVEFEYGGMMSAGVQTTPEFAMEENENTSQSIMIEDHSLDYELTCAEIQSMTPDTEMKSMIIAIKTDCDGELTITLPKDVIDTDENGFFVLVDGDETNHKASSVGEFWTLTIPFSYGSEEIEIIGTFVIPEFGTIAALVLVVAISSILIISAKNKQIFIPRM